MSPGAKVFLTLAGIGGIFGALALAASKKSHAASLPAKPGDGGTVVVPPHDGLPPVVTPSEPEGGFDRSGPFAVPGIQDAAEASRNLLRWWSAEGQSLVSGDTSATKPAVPQDFGSRSEDLNGSFGARTRQAAAAFQHYNGLTPEDGALSNPLVLALRRWAASQELPPQALPSRSTPVTPTLPPMVLPAPSSAPPFVPLPPIAPQNAPVVPVPPFIPQAPSPQAAPPVATPPAPVAPLPVLPPLPASPPPAQTLPAAPPAAPAPAPPGATSVSKDTALMVNALLTAEASPNWNVVDPAVEAWQRSRGLKVDGMFGPKSALAVAEEFGTVPIIRFWPKGSQKAAALQAYRAALIEIATHATDQTRAAQLRNTAKREQAQAFGAKPGKAPALPSSLQVTLAKVA
jgi:hypothetical protein